MKQEVKISVKTFGCIYMLKNNNLSKKENRKSVFLITIKIKHKITKKLMVNYTIKSNCKV